MIQSGDRYLPERQCIGCGKRAPKDTLIRISVREDGLAAADPESRIQHRGAYICRDAACIEKAVRRKAFNRLPGMKSGHEGVEKLKEQLLELIGNE